MGVAVQEGGYAWCGEVLGRLVTLPTLADLHTPLSALNNVVGRYTARAESNPWLGVPPIRLIVNFSSTTMVFRCHYKRPKLWGPGEKHVSAALRKEASCSAMACSST